MLVRKRSRCIQLIILLLVVHLLHLLSKHFSYLYISVYTEDVSDLSGRLFVNRPLKLLTLSYHAAPIYDLTDQLQPLGVEIYEHGINSYACQYFNTCRQDGQRLKVINYRSIHQFLGYGDVEEFFATYGGQADWQAIDAFICLHPAATCELFVPFNRSIIILATIRYDNGRVAARDWRRWNDRMDDIAADHRNIIAANNQFDVEYMRYYTGLTPRLLPSRCRYTRAKYNPTRPGYLLGLRRDSKFRDHFIDGINAACRAMNVSVQLASIRDLYPTYKWSDLAAHQGIVPLPCQPSMIGIIEQYRMNIPLFLPSKELLTIWQISEPRILDEMYSHYPDVNLAPHPSQSNISNPNERNSTESVRWWTSLSDWYSTLPEVIMYTSLEDLVVRLNRTSVNELMVISRRMARHNELVERQLDDDWRQILTHVAAHSPNKPH